MEWKENEYEYNRWNAVNAGISGEEKDEGELRMWNDCVLTNLKKKKGRRKRRWKKGRQGGKGKGLGNGKKRVRAEKEEETHSSSSSSFSPISFATRRRFRSEILPVLSSSNNWKALLISSKGSRARIFSLTALVTKETRRHSAECAGRSNCTGIWRRRGNGSRTG